MKEDKSILGKEEQAKALGLARRLRRLKYRNLMVGRP